MASAREPSFASQAGEEDAEAPSRPEVEHTSRIFPIAPFACCPGAALACIPATMQKIQDCTHCILVLGVLANIALLLITGFALSRMTSVGTPVIFVKEVALIVFVVPVTAYAVRVIGQYDDKLMSKQNRAKEEKENLTRSYNDFLSDMDGLLTKSAESSAGLAERSFESKRRDFQRFLERAKQRYANMKTGSKQDQEQLLKQFRRFCINWLKVFEECSIDPVKCPKQVVTKEELNRCNSIAEVADLCLERLRVTEVRFISIQRDQDAQMLRKNRNDFRRLTVQPEGGRLALPAPAANAAAAATETANTISKKISWIQCGRKRQTGVAPVVGPDGYPSELGCICCRLVLLSREHVLLIMCFFLGVGVILFQLWHLLLCDTLPGLDEIDCQDRKYKASPMPIALTMISQFCILTMLIRFEEIDIIQQLEREVQDLTKQNKEVEAQRKKMGEFWRSCGELTELWLYRTVPRLDLYKELHSQLEDASEEDVLTHMAGANQKLEDLEKNLGSLEDWRTCDDTEKPATALSSDDKKKFGKAVNQICQETEFDDILGQLEDVPSMAGKMITNGRN